MSAEELYIRMAEYDDIDDILKITADAFINYQKLSGASKLDALEEEYDTVKRDIDTKLVFAAVLGNEVAGCVRVKIFPDKCAYLTRFAVKTDIQNKGRLTPEGTKIKTVLFPADPVEFLQIGGNIANANCRVGACGEIIVCDGWQAPDT